MLREETDQSVRKPTSNAHSVSFIIALPEGDGSCPSRAGGGGRHGFV
jgi:hypothetical protein